MKINNTVSHDLAEFRPDADPKHAASIRRFVDAFESVFAVPSLTTADLRISFSDKSNTVAAVLQFPAFRVATSANFVEIIADRDPATTGRGRAWGLVRRANLKLQAERKRDR